MHLSTLELQNFRSCATTKVHFRSDLTVLVGANNSGKSNIVDAIRLLTVQSDGRRTRYCEESDLNFSNKASGFQARGIFDGLSESEHGTFLSASNGPDEDLISYAINYASPLDGQRRGRVTFTAGNNEAPDPEPQARELIRHVYLPPLRDAHAALSSGSAGRLEFVLRTLAGEDEIGTLEAKAADSFNQIKNHVLVERADAAMNLEIEKLTAGSVPHRSKLGFAEPTLSQLAKALRVKLGEYEIDPIDLMHTGLGYANLLFLATVVVEVGATTDAALTLFLVEEPEAHLHPQLQTAVLDFLRDAAGPSDTGPTLQVVVTTHSTQLASAVPADQVQIIKTIETEDETKTTCSVPIWKLGIDAKSIRKVDRYLNATRSAMLFGPKVLLVEGIAEQLLVPALASHLVADKKALSRFRSCPIVAIDGVDFEPYIRVLLTPHDGERVADHVIVITDTDPEAPGDRIMALTSLAKSLDASDHLSIHASEITLEADLCKMGNLELLKRAFLDQKPQSDHVWKSEVSDKPSQDRPVSLVRMIKDKDVRKGDFAQFLAERVGDEEFEFTTPEYLRAAIAAASA